MSEINNVIQIRTLPSDISQTDVHPMAILLGFVDYDSSTGNLMVWLQLCCSCTAVVLQRVRAPSWVRGLIALLAIS